MTEESKILQEVRELLDLEADQGLTTEQSGHLADLLRDHPEALDLYIEYSDLEADIQRISGQNLSIGEELVTRMEQGLEQGLGANIENPWKPPVWKAWAVAAGLVLATGLTWMNFLRNDEPAVQGITFSSATLTRAVNAHWKHGADPGAPGIDLRPGGKLPTGHIFLAAGLAQVTFKSGTSVILEAPAGFEVRGDNKGFLHQGLATARVPEGAQGFILDTPALHVVDLGTEFALSASASGLTDVMVIEGEVEVNLPYAPPDADPIRLLENSALRADQTLGTLESIEAADLPAFRRDLPSEVSLRAAASGLDWNAAMNWDDHLPPSPGKDYHVGRGFSQAIDSPTRTKADFGGRSLHLGRGGILRLRENPTGIVNIPNLHLNRGTLKHTPAGKTLRLDGTITLEDDSVIDLVDNSGRILEFDTSLVSADGKPRRILVRQALKRRRFSRPPQGAELSTDSIIRLNRGNPGFRGEWHIQGGRLEVLTQEALGKSDIRVDSAGTLFLGHPVNLPGNSLSLNGKISLGGQDHVFRVASISGQTLEPGLHTFKALQARFPGRILGDGGTLTIIALGSP